MGDIGVIRRIIKTDKPIPAPRIEPVKVPEKETAPVRQTVVH